MEDVHMNGDTYVWVKGDGCIYCDLKNGGCSGGNCPAGGHYEKSN